MRILLDECVDWRLADFITGHDVRTVGAERWSGISDRQLLERAARQFDVLVTTDQNLPFQQNLSRHGLPVVILVPGRRGFEGVRDLVPQLMETLEMPGLPTLVWVPAPPR